MSRTLAQGAFASFEVPRGTVFLEAHFFPTSLFHRPMLRWYVVQALGTSRSPPPMLPSRASANDPWSSRFPCRLWGAVWMIGAVLLLVPEMSQSQARLPEQSLKAAYLYNFGKFLRTDVPSPHPTFDICLIRDEELGPTLNQLVANEQLNGRPVQVRQLKSAQDAHGCSIAFISASEGKRGEADLEALRGDPVLTVSDSPDFLKHGGMIQFLTVESHVRFSVNLDAVRSAKLNLSSELLRVAVAVVGGPPGGGQK